MLDFDATRKSRRRGGLVAAAFVIASFILYLLPEGYQQPIRQILRQTVLRPFIVVQARVDLQRARESELTRVRAQRDSLLAVALAQAPLAEENRQLRAALDLQARAAPTFVVAQVVRVGLTTAEATFLIDVGADDGVVVGSPVVAPEGLLGVVTEVDPHSAAAIDWSHGDFHVSVMTADLSAYGVAEPRRGTLREEDMLVLTGAPFHSDIPPGTRVVTSGRGQLYPRGIPVGTVAGIEDADTGWRKTYLVRPAVRTEAARHVLVGTGPLTVDLSDLWPTSSAPVAGRD